MKLVNLLFSPHLEEGEKISYVAHRHIFTLMKPVSKILFVGFLIPGVLYLLAPFPPFNYIIYGWMAINLVRIKFVYLDWYYDAWLITNMAVIQVMWEGIFTRTSTRLEYHTITGVSYKVKGFIGTIFNFGDVYLELYMHKTNMILKDAYRPKKLEKTVIAAQNDFSEKKAYEDHENLKEMLTAMVRAQSKKKN